MASGLRRELKKFEGPVPSYNQVLEFVAKSLGHSSYASLLKSGGRAPAEPLATEELEASLSNQFILHNAYGALDLGPVQHGEYPGSQLFHGLTWAMLEGTADIVPCSAKVSSVSRTKKGLVLEHGGGLEIYWDDQESQTDERKKRLWLVETGQKVAEDLAFVGPGSLDHFTGPLDPEIELSDEIQVRKDLVERVLKFILSKGLREQALAEMGLNAAEDVFGPGFEKAADPFELRSALGRAQTACGFAMHLKEFRSLAAKLL